jgi:hypothetical protein
VGGAILARHLEMFGVQAFHAVEAFFYRHLAAFLVLTVFFRGLPRGFDPGSTFQ